MIDDVAYIKSLVFICFDVDIEQYMLAITNALGVSSGPVLERLSYHFLKLLS